jgi:ribosomal protein L16 Arg81 hydroxylase
VKLAEVMRPLRVEELEARYFGRRALVQIAEANALTRLLTLAELETRVNDGSASLANLSVIGPDGRKIPASELYAEQTGAAWSERFLRKSRVRELVEAGQSFVLHNMSQITPEVAELIASLEDAFPGYQADVHVYVSPGARATSFLAHRDQPQHKLYLQLFGSTRWTVYRGCHERVFLTREEANEHLEVDFEVTLTEGSVLYLPPRVYHRIENPGGPRVSLSIPFYESSLAQKVDRSHIPLSSWFARRE